MNSLKGTILGCITFLITVGIVIAYFSQQDRYALFSQDKGVFVFDRKTAVLNYCDSQACQMIRPNIPGQESEYVMAALSGMPAQNAVVNGSFPISGPVMFPQQPAMMRSCPTSQPMMMGQQQQMAPGQQGQPIMNQPIPGQQPMMTQQQPPSGMQPMQAPAAPTAQAITPPVGNAAAPGADSKPDKKQKTSKKKAAPKADDSNSDDSEKDDSTDDRSSDSDNSDDSSSTDDSNTDDSASGDDSNADDSSDSSSDDSSSDSDSSSENDSSSDE